MGYISINGSPETLRTFELLSNPADGVLPGFAYICHFALGVGAGGVEWYDGNVGCRANSASHTSINNFIVNR